MVKDRERDLSSSEIRDLHRIVGIMIPADSAHGVPAASDPAILADVLKSLGRDHADIVESMAELAALSGGSFADLDDAAADAIAHSFLATGTRAVGVLGRVVLQSYYRDDRVLRALGHEARAPFPKGYALEQGDWSLLDAVRQRPQFWRDDRGA